MMCWPTSHVRPATMATSVSHGDFCPPSASINSAYPFYPRNEVVFERAVWADPRLLRRVTAPAARDVGKPGVYCG